MIRPLVMEDWQVVSEMLADWPLDSQGPCTPDRCVGMMRRWMQQNHPVIFEVEGVAVGLNNYSYEYDKCHLSVIHPAHRGKGYWKQMDKETAAWLLFHGVTEMTFEALDQSKFLADKFENQGAADGETGTVHRGRITADDYKPGGKRG